MRFSLLPVVLGVALLPDSGVAQRVKFGGDSAATLLAKMPPATRRQAQAYLDAADDSAAAKVIRDLRLDTAAAPFILAILPKDRTYEVRERIVSAVSNYEQWANVPGVVPALRERLQNDPDSAIVDIAASALQRTIIRQSGIRDVIQRRHDREDNPGIARLLAERDEHLAFEEFPVDVPMFMRTPPPVFEVAPKGASVRFAVIGDYGDSRDQKQQQAVAAAIARYHRAQPLTFSITTGDNFYPRGLFRPDDPRWQTQWEDLYTPLGIPFYVSLGNHDWYGDPASPASEVTRTRMSKSWHLPAIYYTYTAGPAQFFVVNTNALTMRQMAWLRGELAKSTAKWKVIYGHFPIYETTNYSVADPQKYLLPIVKEFKVDMYINGHHHTLQHFSLDGSEFVTSGAAGAGNYGLGDPNKTHPGRKYAASIPGFAAISVDQSAMTLRFIGTDDKVLYEYTRKK